MKTRRRDWILAVAMTLLWGCSPPAPSPASGPELPNVSLELLDRIQSGLIEKARAAVLGAPQSAQAWGKLGQSYHAVEYHEAARQCYLQAVALDPGSARWRHLLGLLQLQEEPELGLANLRRAAELAGEEVEAPRLRLAQALVERGYYEEAVTHLEQLLARDPLHPAARVEMARVQLIRNELTAATQSLTPCVTNSYTARPALLLMAQILQRQGEGQKAGALSRQAGRMPRPFDWPDSYMREVLRLRVDRQKLQDHINSLLMAQRLPEAQDALGRLLGAFPDDAEGLLLLGRFHFQSRRYAEAEAAYRRHLALQSDSLNGLIQLALALLAQERWAEADQVLRRAIALKPDFAEAHFNLAYACSRAGDQPGAIRSYQEALRCRPGYVAAHVALAEAFFRAGRNDEAEEHLQRSLALEPSNAKARKLREQHPVAP